MLNFHPYSLWVQVSVNRVTSPMNITKCRFTSVEKLGTPRIFVENIPLHGCQKQMDAPWWILLPLFLTSVTIRGIHLFRFCVSGLSNRSSFPSLCAHWLLVNIHSRKQFKGHRVFFCVFSGTSPFITVFISLSFRGLPKCFLVATAVFFFGFFERGIWKSGSSFSIEHAITQIPMKLESANDLYTLKHLNASYNSPWVLVLGSKKIYMEVHLHNTFSGFIFYKFSFL